MRFAEVAVDAPTGHDRTYSYSIPESLTVRPGHLVRVPFGARRLQGLVFELSPVPQVPETRSILGVMGDEPILSKTRLDLARWISRYYMSSLFDAAVLIQLTVDQGDGLLIGARHAGADHVHRPMRAGSV